ncbi:hypothetical protein HDU92_008505 [Lobulomyces angularis]|nr:hypothetical protein HDU92_008505 [Lobulomyces angularis]
MSYYYYKVREKTKSTHKDFGKNPQRIKVFKKSPNANLIFSLVIPLIFMGILSIIILIILMIIHKKNFVPEPRPIRPRPDPEIWDRAMGIYRPPVGQLPTPPRTP